MIFHKIRIQRYRSINNLRLTFQRDKEIVICGANNVGKTNFLRALDLFFSLDANKFDAEKDIPHEITEGKRGSGFNTTITGYFEDDTKNKIEIKTVFKRTKDKGNVLEIKASKNNSPLSETEARTIISNFRFIFIEASNINIPKIIDEIIDQEVLPFALDGLRKKQTEPLIKFNEFIEASKKAVEKLTKDIEKILNDFIVDIPGIDTKDWKIKIIFSEYEKLREALSGIIDFTLYDKNDREMESKGSGIQRIVLLSLMKYVAGKINKKIIWGIDEPEVFLQPALQKRVFSNIQEIALKQQVLLTSHSNNFVDLKDTTNTFLFEANHEPKTFARRPKEVFYTTSTFIKEGISEYEKIQKIKIHLGIDNNDSWVILPYNILVEGEEDREYIKTLAKKFNYELPNILIAGGVPKIKGYLQFLKEFCVDLSFKPKIRIIFDYDNEGRAEYESLKTKLDKYKEFELMIEYIPRCDGQNAQKLDYEIEDFVYPEIIREATNKFLKKQGYEVIQKNQMEDRFKKACNGECVLKFLGNKTKENNSDKDQINFEDQNKGGKKIICKNACDLLAKRDITVENDLFPKVKEYVKEICEQK